jgi:4-hydroxybenzoate polyprenyltransferase
MATQQSLSIDSQTDDFPICVDLDRTIVRVGTLAEGVLALMRSRPLHSWKIILWSFGGRASLRQRLADHAPLDVRWLPYDNSLLETLRQERAVGRRIVMATAANRSVAESVAQHLGLFDEVLASNGTTDLKREIKRDAILARFPVGGFDYIGSDFADLPSLKSSRRRFVVNPSAALRRAIKHGQVEDVEVLERQGSSLLGSITAALRVHQWVKNLILLLPLALAHQIADPKRFFAVILGMLAFSLISSTSYIINDLLDVEVDRRHPAKRERPFACGALSLAHGLTLASVCLVGAVITASFLGSNFLRLLIIYLAVAVGYSISFKRVVLFDVFILASMYTLRVLAGGAAASVEVSQWMLAFSMFFFLGLAFVKRYSELRRLSSSDEQETPGRGYKPSDGEQIRTLGVSSGFMAVLVLALYLNGPAVVKLYAQPNFLWLSCVFLTYWTCRVWLLAYRGQIHEDPLLFAMHDRPTYLLTALTGLAVVLASL